MSPFRFKPKYVGLLSVAVVAIIIGFGIFTASPWRVPPAQPKPEPMITQHETYFIYDDATGKELMKVSLVPVNVNDELVTDENKRYVVVRVEENRAYARYVETINLEKYKKS